MKRLNHFLIALGFLAFSVTPALAQENNDGNSASAVQTILDTAWRLIASINGVIIWASGFIAVIMLIIGGLNYISGHADVGKKIIVSTVTGIFIVMAYWAIVQMIRGLF